MALDALADGGVKMGLRDAWLSDWGPRPCWISIFSLVFWTLVWGWDGILRLCSEPGQGLVGKLG